MAKNPFVTQAQQLALVRYGPEVSALTALLRQATQTRKQTVRSGRSAADFIQSSVDQSAPTIRRTYRDALKTADTQYAAVPAGSPASTEQAGLKSRLALEQAQATSQLQDDRIGAANYAASTRRQAWQDFRDTSGQIGTRTKELKNEYGAYASSTLQGLISDAAAASAAAANQQAGRDSSLRNALIGQGLMPTYDKHGNLTGYTPLPGGKADPNAPTTTKPNAGRGWASQPAQSKAGDTIQYAVKEAKLLKQAASIPDKHGKVTPLTRAEAEQTLLNGLPGSPAQSRPIYNTATGKPRYNKDGTVKQRIVPAVPPVTAIKDNLYVQAALDLTFDGHLSRRTENLLHARGIKINPLGVTTYGEFLKRLAAATARPGSAPNLIAGGAGGGSIPSNRR